MLFPKFYPGQIVGVDVFLERFQTRVYVGQLKKEKNTFIFSYDKHYLNLRNVLPLGPEFPLTQQEFTSATLFPSFLDRLPDPNNPAYPEYCTQVGIAVTTTDPLILLATFKRGPSSFIFEPVYKNKYTYQDIEKVREMLGLSLQDFANLFDISLSSLQKIKSGDTPGKDILQQIELYLEVPEALEFQLQQNEKWLHPEKLKKIEEYLEERKHLKNFWHILSHNECAYTQTCIQQIQPCSWAQDLIEKINKERFTPLSMPLLFEIRFAYALYKTDLAIQNSYKAGTKNSEIKDSDVDFCVTEKNGTKWLIELTSIDESDEVKENTVVSGNFQFYKGDLLKSYRRAQSAFFGKAAKLDKKDRSIIRPTKFPLPESNQYHIIILDMRGFGLNGSGLDEGDYKSIVDGEVDERHVNQLTHDFNKLAEYYKNILIGIFDSRHPDPRAKYLQERIHAVGFLNEKNYADGEIEEILDLFPNPKFSDIANELISSFPLKKSHYINPTPTCTSS